MEDPVVRMLVTSDWHLDAVTASVERYDEIEKSVDAVVEYAEQLCSGGPPPWFVFLGDLSNPDPPRCWRAVAKAVAVAVRLSVSGVPSIWITGNHDVLEDGHGSHTLLPLKALQRAEQPLDGKAPILVVDAPQVIRVGRLTSVLCLPYTPRTHNYDPAVQVREAQLSDAAAVFGHLMLEGIGPGSETTDFARGRDVFLPLEEIARALPRAAIFNGHYHRRQVYRGVNIPGALARLVRSDSDIVPQFLEVEL